jgi:hypothetical protein
MKIQYILHSKALRNIPKWYFWYANIPSGNPGANSTTAVHIHNYNVGGAVGYAVLSK